MRLWAKVFICSFVLLIASGDLFGQKKLPSHFVVEGTYGGGGLWTLGSLDFIPKYGLTVGMGWRAENTTLSFVTGLEEIDEFTFFPLQFRVEQFWDRYSIYLDAGYAFANNQLFNDNERIDYEGGSALGLHFSYIAIKGIDFKAAISFGYDYRFAQIEFREFEIFSDQHFHHLSLKARLIIE